MKRSFLTFLLAICFSGLLKAQAFSELPTRSIYVELGGAGLPYSVNYDFRFDKSRLDSWGMRIGAGGWARKDDYSSNTVLTIPVQINKLMGKDKHFFEIGAGATFVRYRDTFTHFNGSRQVTRTDKDWSFILPTGDTPALMGTLNLGYRRIPVDGGFTFRANLNPIFNHNGFWPLWLGVGFG